MVVLGQIPSYPSLVLMTLSPFYDEFDSVGVASDFAKSSPITQSETTLEKSIWSSFSRLSIERVPLHNWRGNFHCFGIDICYDEFWILDPVKLTTVLNHGTFLRKLKIKYLSQYSFV